MFPNGIPLNAIREYYGYKPIKNLNEKENNVMKDELIFAKVREGAKIPTKRTEDAGRDLYPCFEQDFMVIYPLETELIPTGIATAFSSKYYAQIEERGSTGSKGIKYGAGVIDSGYRGEWFVPITNCNNVDLIIAKKGCFTDNFVHSYFGSKYKYILYPYEKAIAQFVMHLVPEFEEKEVSYEELQNIKSERGAGALGSSGK